MQAYSKCIKDISSSRGMWGSKLYVAGYALTMSVRDK